MHALFERLGPERGEARRVGRVKVAVPLQRVAEPDEVFVPEQADARARLEPRELGELCGRRRADALEALCEEGAERLAGGDRRDRLEVGAARVDAGSHGLGLCKVAVRDGGPAGVYILDAYAADAVQVHAEQGHERDDGAHVRL